MYYFITYLRGDGAGDMGIANAAIDEHPIDWLRDVNTMGQYVMLGWQEIGYEDYKKYGHKE